MKPGKRFILKVTVSKINKNGNDNNKQKMLVHNKSRSIQWQGDIDGDTIDAMKGRTKAYFWAEVTTDDWIKIFDEATHQNW